MNPLTKTETFTLLIAFIESLKNKYQSDYLKDLSKELRTSFENHISNTKEFLNPLEQPTLYLTINDKEKNTVNLIKEIILKPDYHLNQADKFKNPLRRRFESELPIALIMHPTTKMMEVLQLISTEIISILRSTSGEEAIIKEFLYELTEAENPIAFGAFKVTPSLSDVVTILTDNKSTQFAEIMHIHFKYAQNVYRERPISPQLKKSPSGHLENILNKYWSSTADITDFFGVDGAGSPTMQGYKHRSYIPDNLFYGSDLYKACGGNRGRKDDIKGNRSNKMGLLLFSQEEHCEDFPVHHSRWVADAKNQDPNFNSPYVTDLINNDAIYVSGPSGMTGLLLGQMETLGNLKSVELKQTYLCCIFSYIVGGGFHSTHEVIGPAEYILKLVPGYQISVPSYEKQASAPNYSVFFNLMQSIDPDFTLRYEQAWHAYLQYFIKFFQKSETYPLVVSHIMQLQEKNKKPSFSFYKPAKHHLSVSIEEETKDNTYQ